MDTEFLVQDLSYAARVSGIRPKITECCGKNVFVVLYSEEPDKDISLCPHCGGKALDDELVGKLNAFGGGRLVI